MLSLGKQAGEFHVCIIHRFCGDLFRLHVGHWCPSSSSPHTLLIPLSSFSSCSSSSSSAFSSSSSSSSSSSAAAAAAAALAAAIVSCTLSSTGPQLRPPWLFYRLRNTINFIKYTEPCTVLSYIYIDTVVAKPNIRHILKATKDHASQSAWPKKGLCPRTAMQCVQITTPNQQVTNTCGLELKLSRSRT